MKTKTILVSAAGVYALLAYLYAKRAMGTDPVTFSVYFAALANPKAVLSGTTASSA